MSIISVEANIFSFDASPLKSINNAMFIKSLVNRFDQTGNHLNSFELNETKCCTSLITKLITRIEKYCNMFDDIFEQHRLALKNHIDEKLL